MDGWTKCTAQILEDMLIDCVIHYKGSWDNNLPFIEFAYNNSYTSSIQMTPYEALYGRGCRSPVGWLELGEATLIRADLVQNAMERVQLIRDILRTSHSCQNSYADVRRRELKFQFDY